MKNIFLLLLALGTSLSSLAAVNSVYDVYLLNEIPIGTKVTFNQSVFLRARWSESLLGKKNDVSCKLVVARTFTKQVDRVILEGTQLEIVGPWGSGFKLSKNMGISCSARFSAAVTLGEFAEVTNGILSFEFPPSLEKPEIMEIVK